MNTVTGSTNANFENRLIAFEEAWRCGVPPDLSGYLTPSSGTGDDNSLVARIQELLGLIPLDLEYRWREPASRLRGSLTPRPRLEDYLARYPELNCPAGVPPELVEVEYRIRRIWGDRPDMGEYLVRFPALAEALPEELGRIDDEIAREYPGPCSDITSPPPEVATASKPCETSADLMIEGLKFLGELGRGAMGIVYKARDQKLGRIVAIKTLAEGKFATQEQVERFQAEAHAIARLRHPNVIAIHTIGEHDNRPYLSLEFAEGGSLAQRLAEKPMAPREAAALVETLSRAVQAAHKAGIVHRDLKPSNVLLTADVVPKVGDFGLAKLLDADSGRTLSGQVMGTPSYMAPEQAEGHSKQVGPAADTYALGAILYHALTGRPPFLGESAMETLKLVTSTEVVAPGRLRPEVPRDLETICLKCLEKAPIKRYATALDLAESLGRFQRGEPVLARRIGPFRRLSKWTKRHPWQSISAAILLIAAAVFLGLTYRHNVQLRAEVSRTEEKATEARRNYQEARSTIQAMIARVNDHRLAGTPKLLDLRHSLHEDAQGFYARILAKIDTNDPVIRADTAKAFAEASVLEIYLGHPEQAEKPMRRALDLIQSARAERPEEVQYLGIHVICLLRLAGLLNASGRSDQAVELGREAVQKAGLLASKTPDDLTNQELVAACLEIHGNSFWALKRFADARGLYRQGIEIREHISPAKLPGVTSRLAGSLMNEGLMFWKEQNISEAEKRFSRAEKALLSILPEERVAAEDYELRLSQLYMNWGGMLYELRRFDQAIARIDDGLRTLEPHLRIDPNDASARQTSLELHGNRGLALSALGKHRESADEWKRVIELSTGSVPPKYRIGLAIELLYAGELARASAEAQLVKPAPDISGDDCYNLACIYSRSAIAARDDPSILPNQRAPLVNSHITKALDWLKAATKAGFFREPANRDQAKTDTDLEILRERQEFRQLIESNGTKP